MTKARAAIEFSALAFSVVTIQLMADSCDVSDVALASPCGCNLLHNSLLAVDDVETITLWSADLAALNVVDLSLVIGVNLQTLDSCRAAVGVGEDSVETRG